MWDVRTPDNEVSTRKIHGEGLRLHWKPDGQTIGVVNDRGVLSFIDVKSFDVVNSLKLEYAILGFSWNKTEDLIYISTSLGTIEMWSYPGLQKVSSFQSSYCAIEHFCFDPTGRYLASGGRDAII